MTELTNRVRVDGKLYPALGTKQFLTYVLLDWLESHDLEVSSDDVVRILQAKEFSSGDFVPSSVKVDISEWRRFKRVVV